MGQTGHHLNVGLISANYSLRCPIIWPLALRLLVWHAHMDLSHCIDDDGDGMSKQVSNKYISIAYLTNKFVFNILNVISTGIKTLL